MTRYDFIPAALGVIVGLIIACSYMAWLDNRLMDLDAERGVEASAYEVVN